MISGFLISYVITEGGRYNSRTDFYLSRYIRLFPLYFIVAIGAFFWNIIINNSVFFETINLAAPVVKALLIFSNVFIFLQDWVFFIPEIFPDNRQATVPLYLGLLVPQAWSLGLELCFYLLAPYLLIRRRLVLIVFFSSLGLRVVFWNFGLADVDPWSYRFFPLELSLFLAGALSHQIMLGFYVRSNKLILFYGKYAATASLLLFCGCFFLIPLEESTKLIYLLVLSFLFLPFLFLFQQENKIDQLIGDLSYPIYVTHLLVISIVAHFRSRFGEINQLTFSLICLGATLLISWWAVVFLLEPIDRFRSRFRGRKMTFANKLLMN